MSKCRGCGRMLQSDDVHGLGYTSNLENVFCERCFRLRNYGEYSVPFLNSQDYREMLRKIPTNSLVLYVADCLNLNLTYLDQFSRVILVLTKRDILPKSILDRKLVSYIQKRYSKLLDVVIVSSFKNYHLDILYDAILQYCNGQDVYVVGYTNSGKSTLVNQMVHSYGKCSYDLTVSMFPSTTLDFVEIFFDHFKMIDTPGLIDDGSYFSVVGRNDLKLFMPKKEIKPKSCQVIGRGSILIGNYVRIDYDAKEKTSFVIYVSNLISSQFISFKNSSLRELKDVSYHLVGKQDIVIPGLGFVKFVGPIRVTFYVPNLVNVFVRDSFC